MPEFLALVAWPNAGTKPTARRVAAANADAVAVALGVPPTALLRVQELSAAGGGAGLPRRAAAWSLRTPRLDLRLFGQELALLLRAGIPLLEALVTLQEKDLGRPSSAVIGRVVDALRDGLPLSAALAQGGADFDALFRAIVAASERSGQVATALAQHAEYLAWSQRLRARLVAAAIYPLLLLAAGAAVMLFLLLYVLPRFAGVFEGLAIELPAASALLVGFGAWAGAHRPLVLGVAVLAALGVVAAARSHAARTALAWAAWRAPGLGSRWRVVVLARLYRGLALLLAAGVSVPAALRLLQDTLVAPLQTPLAAARLAVEGGQRLSVALAAQGLATPVALRMVKVGEDSGELATMLARAAAFHDEEIERFTDLVSRAVNPVLMLVMGVLIGTVVVLMYLPIFTLMEQVQ